MVVSSIYIWYREDFGGNDRGVVEHLREHAVGELAAALAGYAGGLADGYDWSLNGTRPTSPLTAPVPRTRYGSPNR